jgi:hypothetical protein
MTGTKMTLQRCNKRGAASHCGLLRPRRAGAVSLSATGIEKAAGHWRTAATGLKKYSGFETRPIPACVAKNTPGLM